MILRVALLFLVAGCAADSSHLDDESSATRLQRTATPAFLYTSFRQLDSVLTGAQRDSLARVQPESTTIYHLGLGMYIRNSTGLWRQAPVAESLAARGIRHPDDMSGIILAAYAQYLRGDSVDLQRAIAAQPKPPQGFKVLSAPIKVP